MKISRYYKEQGATVSFYNPFDKFDVVYASKIFTFTPDYGYYIDNADAVEKGGTGYDIQKRLPAEIERVQPDYSLYSQIDKKTAYGFITRGCPNRCPWCLVPKKEGKTCANNDVDEIAIENRTNLILMDNNILSSEYGLNQLKKIIDRGYRVDFNQGLDARLVTPEIAEMLAKIKWIKYIRFGCDTPGQIIECEKAMALIDKFGYNGNYFLYCILKDFKESFERVNHWRGNKRITPFAQPYRDFDNKNTIPQWQKDMARWVDKKELYNTCEFKDYGPRKGFKCKEYLI